jgi:hypothetical protein
VLLGLALGQVPGRYPFSQHSLSLPRSNRMATGGGGGGEWSGESSGGGESPAGVRRCGSASAAGGRMEGFVDLAGEAEVAAPPLPPLPPPSPPRPDSEKWWTSPGRTSMNDPMSHYLYNGSG